MKVLTIEKCQDCPYFLAKAISLDNDHDSFLAICNHPDVEDIFEWLQKRGRAIEPPPKCPLPNSKDVLVSA